MIRKIVFVSLYSIFVAILEPIFIWADSNEYPNTRHRLCSGINYELATNKFFYILQDTLNIKYTITNKTHPFIIFRYPSSPAVDIALFLHDNNIPLWSYLSEGFKEYIVEFKKLLFNESWSIQYAIQFSTIGSLSAVKEPQRLVVVGVLGKFDSSDPMGGNFPLLLSSTSFSFSSLNDPFFLNDYFEANINLEVKDPNFDPMFDFNEDGVLNFNDMLTWSDQESNLMWMPSDPDSTLITLPITARIIRIDFNQDGIINFDDYLLFSQHFGTTLTDSHYGENFDLNGDGKINLSDFFIFADRFGTVEK